MEKNGVFTDECYFGASNSFYGFKNYFNTIFKQDEIDRLYVIKGGPGTGKSSFMKKVISELSESSECEAIFCSSDPSSLDGVIIKHNQNSIAFLDGTAPHATEAVIPGAWDELIDLGKNWDSKWLIGSKEKIESLTKEKAAAYETAYSYLGIAGKCDSMTQKFTTDPYICAESKKMALKFCKDHVSVEEPIRNLRLVSSFGKYGKYSLDTLNTKGKKRIKLIGNHPAGELFLKDLKNALDTLEIGYTLFPTALSPDIYESIYLPKNDVLIGFIDSDEVFDCDTLTAPAKLQAERFKVANNLMDFALNEAQRWFSIASDLHFRLEEIYSAAMDFSKNDYIFTEKMKECKDILGLSS